MSVTIDEHLDVVRVQSYLVGVVQDLSPDERRELRERLGWSRAEAAGWLGVAPSTFASYENGSVLPRGKLLYLYAQLLEIAGEQRGLAEVAEPESL
jgi:DNA-binding XRE family transcriptional regulator